MFITKDNHVVIMEQGYAVHEQPGDGWAPLGIIFARDKSHDSFRPDRS